MPYGFYSGTEHRSQPKKVGHPKQDRRKVKAARSANRARRR